MVMAVEGVKVIVEMGAMRAATESEVPLTVSGENAVFLKKHVVK